MCIGQSHLNDTSICRPTSLRPVKSNCDVDIYFQIPAICQHRPQTERGSTLWSVIFQQPVFTSNVLMTV